MMNSFIPILFIAIMHINVGMTGMAGGWSPVTDVNSIDFQKYVDFATDKISSGFNSLYRMKPIEVLKAEKQVVSGMNYRFNFRMGTTECKKNVHYSEDEIKHCDVLSCEPVHNCNATVWDQPWKEDGMKLTKHSCQPEPNTC